MDVASRWRTSSLVVLILVVSSVVGSSRSGVHRDSRREPDASEGALLEWNRARLSDPATGEPPADAARQDAQWLAAQSPPTTSTASPEWIARGPFEVGGRARDVQIDVTNEQVLLVACVSGGIWRSEDEGAHWRQTLRPDQMPNVVSLAQDTRPGHTDVWYAGTGEASGSGTGQGDGVYKSTDGGRTWALLPSTRGQYEFLFVGRVATDPSNTTQDEVYAAANDAVFRSVDGGATWEPILTGSWNYDLRVTARGEVYAVCGSGTGVGPDAASILRSPNGMSWTNITPSGWPVSAANVAIAIAPVDPTQVLFFTEWNSSRYLWEYHYRSGDGSGAGGTWRDRSADVPWWFAGTQSTYCIAAGIGTNGPDDFWIGGVSLLHNVTAWNAGFQLCSGFHPDVHAFAFPASRPTRVYAATDGGLYVTDDPSQPFRPLTHGCVTTQFYAVAIDPRSSGDAIAGGTQDNGTFYAAPDSGARDLGLGGDGSFSAVLPDGMSVLFQWAFQGVYLDDLRTGATRSIAPPGTGQRSWLMPFAMDPNDGTTIYYPLGYQLWRALDARTPAWSAIDESHVGDVVVTAVGVSTANPAHRVWFGNQGAMLVRQDDALSSTPPRSVVVTPPWRAGVTPSSISVDSENGDRVLVSVSNYNVKSLFFSADAGVTWSEVGGNLENTAGQLFGYQGPAVFATAILARPDGSRIYFAGTSTGLFTTTQLNGPATVWTQEGANTIGNRQVVGVAARSLDGFVAVATHGAGLFSTHYAVKTVTVEAAAATGPIRLEPPVPNPARQRTSIAFTLPRPSHARVEIFDFAGRRVALVMDGVASAGRTQLPADVRGLAPGTYLLRLTAGGAVQAQRLTVLR